MLVFASCDRDVFMRDPVQDPIRQFTQLSELGTVEYTVTKVVKVVDHPKWYQFGDRKLLFTCKATLKAGIDMSGFSPDDVTVNKSQRSATVTLPKAKLLTFNMDPKDCKLAFVKIGGIRHPFTAEERNAVLIQGEKSIRDNIGQYGILEDAETNASEFVKMVFSKAGIYDVTVKFR